MDVFDNDVHDGVPDGWSAAICGGQEEEQQLSNVLGAKILPPEEPQKMRIKASKQQSLQVWPLSELNFDGMHLKN